jgi:hypothetical protein
MSGPPTAGCGKPLTEASPFRPWRRLAEAKFRQSEAKSAWRRQGRKAPNESARLRRLAVDARASGEYLNDAEGNLLKSFNHSLLRQHNAPPLATIR